MADTLLAHFVDGSDAEISITFNRKCVEMTALDEKTHQWYHLTFTNCTRISAIYSDEEEKWADLNNLTDGVSELQTTEKGVRRFEIGFADESVLQIECRNFTMEPVSKPLPWLST